MGTASFLRSIYAMLWLGLISLVAGGVWWVVFKARPPAALGPVASNAVRTEALDPAEAEPVEVEKRPEPAEAFLDEAELSVASPDGSVRLDVEARHAQKQGKLYRLKAGTIRFHSEEVSQLELSITDGTYILDKGVAYVEGSMTGRIGASGQHFSAERLRWDAGTNLVRAEAVTLTADSLEVSGELMKIQLPAGIVDFEGPVKARISGLMGS